MKCKRRAALSGPGRRRAVCNLFDYIFLAIFIDRPEQTRDKPFIHFPAMYKHTHGNKKGGTMKKKVYGRQETRAEDGGVCPSLPESAQGFRASRASDSF